MGAVPRIQKRVSKKLFLAGAPHGELQVIWWGSQGGVGGRITNAVGCRGRRLVLDEAEANYATP